MVGDQADFLRRLKAVLPTSWFADDTPVLDNLLSGLGSAWSWVYGLRQYLQSQTRISTATDIFLDIIASDFFGSSLVRKINEPDESLRARIKSELFRDRGTRNSVITVLADLTGRTPIVFEPACSTDTGGYGSIGFDGGGIGYCVGGGWGSTTLPFQCFITTFRPTTGGIAQVAGWGSPNSAYGSGTTEYASLEMAVGQIMDQDIYDAVAGVMPIATIGWTRIQN